jgi:DNA-binding CsgD family transcriptional regulator
MGSGPSSSSVTVLPSYPRPVFVPTLTRTEREVIDHLALGMTYAEIASALAVSHNTVKSHLQHAFRKLGVHDRRAAVYYATGVARTTPILQGVPIDAPVTLRQREVLAHAAQGMTNREIAYVLFITTNTVKTHLRRASLALGTHSRHAAAAAVAAAEQYASDPKAA